MIEAEAIDAHDDHLLRIERARHKLTFDVRELERVGARLIRTGERTLKIGVLVMAALGGVLFGALLSIALHREGG
ncbi:MAG TPA: hypothetical protein VGM29_10150 [Polyangiaceae bacterium]|jgi:hypothetical protein